MSLLFIFICLGSHSMSLVRCFGSKLVSRLGRFDGADSEKTAGLFNENIKNSENEQSMWLCTCQQKAIVKTWLISIFFHIRSLEVVRCLSQSFAMFLKCDCAGWREKSVSRVLLKKKSFLNFIFWNDKGRPDWAIRNWFSQGEFPTIEFVLFYLLFCSRGVCSVLGEDCGWSV